MLFLKIICKFVRKFIHRRMNQDYLHYEAIKDPDCSYGKGIAYPSMMSRQIRKHSSYLQPMFEAISNALESTGTTKIEIAVAMQKTLISDAHEFVSLHITDNGCGFNDENFERFVTLFDDTKGFNNLGTGRIQFLHFFRNTQINSVYEKDGEKHLRVISISKDFYNQHKTPFLTSDTIVDSTTPKETTISFFGLYKEEDKSLYQRLQTSHIKHELLTHYLSKFCLTKSTMPTFTINKYVNEVLDSENQETLSSIDIPHPHFQKEVELTYSIASNDKKSILPYKGKTAKFTIQSFSLPYDVIPKNEIYLTSKGETVDSSKFDFSLIKEAPRLGETYMLFLVSSEYLTTHDQDERGKLRLLSKKDLLASYQNNAFAEPEIIIEDIQDNVLEEIVKKYPLIKEAKEKYDSELEKMAELFSLDIDELHKMGVRTGESTESILKRFHEYNGSIQAKKEAQVKALYDSLSGLTPGHPDYVKDFNKKVKSLTSLVPQLVRANLTGYIARRKLVLMIFDLAIQKELECQKIDKSKSKNAKKSKNTPHEKFLHNIFFTQHSTDPKESNLWLLSDEFVHFSGVSEKRLIDVKYQNELFLREDLTDQEREELRHFEHDDIITRPDILLFPEEHKCVIIEFKSPEVELADQIAQINNYASIIRQFAKPKYEITNFYAYLIGEKIDFEAFKRRNPEFESSYYFDYAYCPDKKVYGGARSKGSMYIEVITFSTLLKRATERNKIFIEDL